MLRVYALTNRRRSFLYFLILMASTQSILVVYAISRVRENKALPLPDIPIDAFHICILFSDPVKDMSYLAVSITFDGIVLCLTLAVTVSTSKNRPTMPLLRTIRRDGLIYFFVIFSGNLAWMLLALYARAGLKFMNAQPSMILTSIMINRLTLSLRHHYHKRLTWGEGSFFQWNSDFAVNINDRQDHRRDSMEMSNIEFRPGDDETSVRDSTVDMVLLNHDNVSSRQ